MRSLLPEPLIEGPVLAEWRFVPSSQLGGDAYGYTWLDADTFTFYLLDVSGHGIGSAMHATTVLNVLRQRALPQVDFADPAAVLSGLNARFGMQSHNGLFSDFLPLLLEPAEPNIAEPERIYQSVRRSAAAGPLDDDLSLMVLTFR